MSIFFIFSIKQHLRTFFFRHVYRIIFSKNAFFVSVAISGRFDPKMTGLKEKNIRTSHFFYVYVYNHKDQRMRRVRRELAFCICRSNHATN